MGACGGRPSGLKYLPVFGSGSGSVLALVAAALHSFSSFLSSAHVCAASEQPPFSEIPEEKKKRPSMTFKIILPLHVGAHASSLSKTQICNLNPKDRHSWSTCSSCRRSPHSADSKSSFPF